MSDSIPVRRTHGKQEPGGRDCVSFRHPLRIQGTLEEMKGDLAAVREDLSRIKLVVGSVRE